MSDNEIIKALECCCISECDECPYDEQTACVEILKEGTLALINRQKAENERLRGHNENLQTANTALSNEILDIKSEARKEFAEHLKCGVPQETGVIRCKDVDELLEEMEGQDGLH